MATMDEQIMAEAEKQRVHDLKIQKIKSDAMIEAARQDRMRVESRHELIGYYGVGVAIVTVIATIVGAILWGTMDGRKDTQQRERQRNEIAATCIREGNIWLDGNCIPARKN